LERQITGMKKNENILIGFTSLAVVGLVILIVGKIKKTHRIKERLDRIAEEGYEFAADILYPLKNKTGNKWKSDYDELRSSVY
jgi:hypothetical protein